MGGERARRHPGRLRRIAAAGDAIGNHTDSHADLAQVSARRAGTEMAATSSAVAERDTSSRLREVRPGGIVLAHDGGPTPNPALMQQLSRLLGTLRADCYALVDVATLPRSALAT